MGFNIAEAVNYGSNKWLDKLSKFKGCKCELKVGVVLDSYSEIIKNLTNSINKNNIGPIFAKVKDSQSFKKIQEKANEEAK